MLRALLLMSLLPAAEETSPVSERCADLWLGCKETCTMEFGTSAETRSQLGDCLERCAARNTDCLQGPSTAGGEGTPEPRRSSALAPEVPDGPAPAGRAAAPLPLPPPPAATPSASAPNFDDDTRLRVISPAERQRGAPTPEPTQNDRAPVHEDSASPSPPRGGSSGGAPSRPGASVSAKTGEKRRPQKGTSQRQRRPAAAHP